VYHPSAHHIGSKSLFIVQGHEADPRCLDAFYIASAVPRAEVNHKERPSAQSLVERFKEVVSSAMDL